MTVIASYIEVWNFFPSSAGRSSGVGDFGVCQAGSSVALAVSWIIILFMN